MALDAETAALIADLRSNATLAWGAFMAMGFLFWWVDRLREKGCDRCAHCQERNRKAAEAQEERDRQLRERLFGRQVVEPPKKEPSGDEEPDEGREDP